ncbi:hypothetical protein C9J85_00925 [Haloferax sp. wsp5]|nr:hypothetical protein C9J85_00925 [Haloferax sp. wsp5]
MADETTPVPTLRRRLYDHGSHSTRLSRRLGGQRSQSTTSKSHRRSTSATCAGTYDKQTRDAVSVVVRSHGNRLGGKRLLWLRLYFNATAAIVDDRGSGDAALDEALEQCSRGRSPFHTPES